MKPIALDLDHAGITVRNLHAGRDAFLRLGLTLTQRSHHKGSRFPGSPIEDWGSANHCAMLSQGYLEVAGMTDPEKFSNAKAHFKSFPLPAQSDGLSKKKLSGRNADAM